MCTERATYNRNAFLSRKKTKPKEYIYGGKETYMNNRSKEHVQDDSTHAMAAQSGDYCHTNFKALMY